MPSLRPGGGGYSRGWVSWAEEWLIVLDESPVLRASLPTGVLLAVVAVFLPSLSGGWVWDDHDLFETEAILHPLAYLLGDGWEALTGHPSDLYRPLSLLSFYPGQALVGGPGVERLVSLGVHLLAVLGVAGLGRRLGTGPVLAWLGAALFALHPGSSEAVAWLSARQWELPTALLLFAWWAQLARRDLTAGMLLALLPFFNEAFILAPATAVLWMLARRRFAPVTLGLGLAGCLAYVGIRASLGISLLGAQLGLVDQLAAVGGILKRGIALAILPASADPLVGFVSHPSLGVTALVLALAGLCWLLWTRKPEEGGAESGSEGRGAGSPCGRDTTAALLSGLLLLFPPAQASLLNGTIGDRYLYPFLAILGLAVALELARASVRPRYVHALWVLPVVLAVVAGPRASVWVSDSTLFEASLERDPENPWAAFHRAHDLQVRSEDCTAAIPLYRKALGVDPRAANNLAACLYELGRYSETAEVGPDAAFAAPGHAGPALTTARAFLALGELEQAEDWSREALGRDEGRADAWEVLGAAQGRGGNYGGAVVAFQRVLALEPERPGAEQNLRLARRKLAASRTAPPMEDSGSEERVVEGTDLESE